MYGVFCCKFAIQLIHALLLTKTKRNMKTAKWIIKDLKARQKALSKQQGNLDPDQMEPDEIEWAAAIDAKVELIDGLLELYQKPMRKKSK